MCVVLAGVGGIEAEAVMLGQPISMVLPKVVGYKLVGKLGQLATSTDVVLTITKVGDNGHGHHHNERQRQRERVCVCVCVRACVRVGRRARASVCESRRVGVRA